MTTPPAVVRRKIGVREDPEIGLIEPPPRAAALGPALGRELAGATGGVAAGCE
jgi:hypothetical protein